MFCGKGAIGNIRRHVKKDHGLEDARITRADCTPTKPIQAENKERIKEASLMSKRQWKELAASLYTGSGQCTYQAVFHKDTAYTKTAPSDALGNKDGSTTPSLPEDDTPTPDCDGKKRKRQSQRKAVLSDEKVCIYISPEARRVLMNDIQKRRPTESTTDESTGVDDKSESQAEESRSEGLRMRTSPVSSLSPFAPFVATPGGLRPIPVPDPQAWAAAVSAVSGASSSTTTTPKISPMLLPVPFPHAAAAMFGLAQRQQQQMMAARDRTAAASPGQDSQSERTKSRNEGEENGSDIKQERVNGNSSHSGRDAGDSQDSQVRSPPGFFPLFPMSPDLKASNGQGMEQTGHPAFFPMFVPLPAAIGTSSGMSPQFGPLFPPSVSLSGTQLRSPDDSGNGSTPTTKGQVVNSQPSRRVIPFPMLYSSPTLAAQRMPPMPPSFPPLSETKITKLERETATKVFNDSGILKEEPSGEDEIISSSKESTRSGVGQIDNGAERLLLPPTAENDETRERHEDTPLEKVQAASSCTTNTTDSTDVDLSTNAAVERRTD